MLTDTETRNRPKTNLKLFHGCGMLYNVPGDKLADANGPTLEVLREIARREIADPELAKTLADKNLVIQTFSDEPGATHQRTVNPKQDFADLSAILAEKDLEMAVSVAHRGG